jgi:hypothetical protein
MEKEHIQQIVALLAEMKADRKANGEKIQAETEAMRD